MAALFTGNRPPRLQVDRSLIPVQSGAGVKTEILTIMNEGGGILKGTAISDVKWIRIPNPRIETPFLVPFRIEITPERSSAASPKKGAVTIITNGGTAKINVEYIAHPAVKPGIALDERQFQFCNLRKGEDFSFDLMVRNTGSGLLSGTVESESDWIEVKTRTLWTQSIQAVQVIIKTSKAPGARQPTGRIRIRSTGGELVVPVSINFRSGDGPVMKLSPSRIRCIWDKRGIIEETLTIQNEGTGILRGTIPAPVPWIKILPSIFPVEKSTKILLKIDTRMLEPDRSMSVPIQIITNVGMQILTLEVVPGRRTPVQVRKTRASIRQQPRARLTAYEPDGRVCTLISTGKSGGEGEIYFLAGDDSRCAKIFHPHRRTQEIDDKIRTMVASPPDNELLQFLTWPLKPLTDLPRGGRIIGYIMRRIPEEFRSVHLWYDEPQETGRRNPHGRIAASLQLARLVAGVHKAGHVIGDLRENNLLINNRGELVLIDTDSFQISDKNRRRIFWSRVGTGEYLPPEHLDGSFAESGCDRRYGDHFALAVLIFRFMMDGVHPFQAKGPLVRDAPATTDKILLGYYAFESRMNGISPPDYAPPYSSLPSHVRTLFKETFVSGLRSPHIRPGAARWETVLSSLILQDKKSLQKTTDQNSIDKQRPDRIELGRWSDKDSPETRNEGILFRTETGIITSFGQDIQVFLVNKGIRIPDSEVQRVQGIPRSLVLPLQIVFRDNFPVGWTIPAIDPGRYQPWHMASDPGSRTDKNGRKFHFNHRIATCRNLMAAIISARKHGIQVENLSERTVFVGPDASIRILCLPGWTKNDSHIERGVPPSVLIFRMLMDGYHPFHATGSRTTGSGSNERRMASGLYPWTHEDPTLRPPSGAPSIKTLPKPLVDLFEEEFKDRKGDGTDHTRMETWFEVFDQVYRGLICCTRDPDHWYLSSSDGCPWCNQKLTTAEIVHIRAPQKSRYSIVLLLMAPKVAGLLQERYRRRRTRNPVRTESSRWATIPLPPERIIYTLLPRQCGRPTLGSGEGQQYQPVWYTRSCIACVHPPEKPKGDQDETHLVPLSCIPEMIPPPTPGMDEITLIDEMIWVSAMDRLRGEGIDQTGKKRRTKAHEITHRKRPVEIMLFPIDLPFTENRSGEIEVSEEVLPNQGEQSHKRRKRLRIRARLQTLLRDFIGVAESEEPSCEPDESGSIRVPGSEDAQQTKHQKVAAKEEDHDLHSLDR
nr:hypothetical protein [uncultured Methanospirillum sp.]